MVTSPCSKSNQEKKNKLLASCVVERIHTRGSSGTGRALAGSCMPGKTCGAWHVQQLFAALVLGPGFHAVTTQELRNPRQPEAYRTL